MRNETPSRINVAPREHEMQGSVFCRIYISKQTVRKKWGRKLRALEGSQRKITRCIRQSVRTLPGVASDHEIDRSAALDGGALRSVAQIQKTHHREQELTMPWQDLHQKRDTRSFDHKVHG